MSASNNLNTAHGNAPDDSENDKISQLVGREVYTNQGVYIGEVRDLELDFQRTRIKSLALDRQTLNTDVLPPVENKAGLLIPYRFVQSVGDVVITSNRLTKAEDQMPY